MEVLAIQAQYCALDGKEIWRTLTTICEYGRNSSISNMGRKNHISDHNFVSCGVYRVNAQCNSPVPMT